METCQDKKKSEKQPNWLWKNINEKIKNMPWKLKKILGYQEFLDSKKIVEFIEGVDNTQDFTKNKSLLFEETKGLRLWIIASATNVFIVKDTGDDEPKILLNRKKDNFKFNLIFEKNKPRLYIENTITTLPYNQSLTGDTRTFETKLNEIIEL